MFRFLGVHRSGFYAWMRKPESDRLIEDLRLLKKIRHFYDESDQVYGNPRFYEDLAEEGEPSYELYLAVEDIDHTKTKTKSPQTNGMM